MAFDNAQNLYVADGNAKVRIISPSGTMSTFAGTGALGYSGDSGPATNATFDGLSAVTVDGLGNKFIAESNNSVIRKINTSGIVTTIAGTHNSLGFSGDGGPAILAN